ncbi:hypothetical protein PFISCL1PPCAC_25585, partial [Pristionchus fissidentatus]
QTSEKSISYVEVKLTRDSDNEISPLFAFPFDFPLHSSLFVSTHGFLLFSRVERRTSPLTPRSWPATRMR